MPSTPDRKSYLYAERVRERLPRALQEAREAVPITKYGLEQKSGITREMIGRSKQAKPTRACPYSRKSPTASVSNSRNWSAGWRTTWRHDAPRLVNDDRLTAQFRFVLESRAYQPTPVMNRKTSNRQSLVKDAKVAKRWNSSRGDERRRASAVQRIGQRFPSNQTPHPNRPLDAGGVVAARPLLPPLGGNRPVAKKGHFRPPGRLLCRRGGHFWQKTGFFWDFLASTGRLWTSMHGSWTSLRPP